MKVAHTVTLSVFIKPEDDAERVREGFFSLIPFDVQEEKVPVLESVSLGFNDRRITVLEVRLEKERHTRVFIGSLVKGLSGAQKQQLREQDNRVDDGCNFYVRFSKDYLPKLVLTDGGDCVHVKVALAAFPKRRNVALHLVKEMFL